MSNGAVPDGWVLVPKPEFRAMLHYTECYADKHPSSGARETVGDYFETLLIDADSPQSAPVPVKMEDIVARIVCDVCELDPADPDHPDTLKVKVADLAMIVELALLDGAEAKAAAADEPLTFNGVPIVFNSTMGADDIRMTQHSAGLVEAGGCAPPVIVGPPSLHGWIVANAAEDKFRTWGDWGPDWTPNRADALRFVLRSDAEKFAEHDEDAWKIVPFDREHQAAQDDDTWEANVRYLLDSYPGTIRVREGGGPESLIASLSVTFIKMRDLLKGAAT